MPAQEKEFSFSYAGELTRAMEMLAEDPRVIFLGQAVKYKGTAMSGTLEGISEDRRIEMPVCEEMQMGISIGLSLKGYIPVSVYPRWNFIVLATNQLVNHLDKLPVISTYRPKVIVRVGVGSERPLYPGLQHTGDFSNAFRLLCKNIWIEQLTEPEQVFPAYQAAMKREKSTILVEYGDYYNEK